VVSAVGRTPSGERFLLSSESWAAGFRAAFLDLEVTLAKGALGEAQTVRVAPHRLSDLSIAGVIRGDARLASLSQLAERATTAPASEWLRQLEQEMGRTALLDECRTLLLGDAASAAIASAAPPTAPDSGATASDSVDALFERTHDGAPKASTNVLDSLVAAMRGRPATTTSSHRAKPDVADAARRALLQHVDAVARAALAQADVARMESGWRSLRWLLEHCPSMGGVVVEVVDAPASEAAALLAQLPREDDFEEPDLLAVADVVSATEALAALAQLGAARLAPVVAAWGSASPTDAVERAFNEACEPGQPYASLLEEERARWLCLTWNSIIVHDDASGLGARTVVGSPVWAVLASVATSFVATGAFARILGNAGSVRAAGTARVGGRDGDMAIPTARFVSIRAQAALAACRVVALGSGRNSDRIVISDAPTLRAARDAVPLPAQIVTGRVARFAEWVALQVPRDAGADDVRQIFEEAAAVFLFPGTTAGELTASLVLREDGQRLARVRVGAPAAHAGVQLDLELVLPLR